MTGSGVEGSAKQVVRFPGGEMWVTERYELG